MLIILQEKTIHPYQQICIDSQFKGEQIEKVKITNKPKDEDDYSAGEKRLSFLNKKFEMAVRVIHEFLDHAIVKIDPSELNVLILVDEQLFMHNVVNKLQESKIKCWVYSKDVDSFIELPNYK